MLNLNWDIHYFEKTESSNLVVKAAIDEGKPAGFVAVAWEQTGGYGMRGHTWTSPKGGLYFSLLLETNLTPEELPTIPLRIANVLLKALQPFSAEKLTIKPQNDIVLARSFTPDYREKLVGVSTEMYRGKLCVGIGVNVFRLESSASALSPCSVTEASEPNPRPLVPQNVPVYLEDFPACELDLETILQACLQALNAKLDI